MSSRYAKEFHRLKQSLEKKTNGQAFIKDWDPDNITTFIVEVSPQGGPYKQGKFLFQIIVPDLYPDVHPDVVCLTDIYHPNIDSDITDEHNICLNLFDEWNKSFGLEDCVQGLIFLLYNPNLTDPISSFFDGSVESTSSFVSKVQASLRGESFDGISFAKNPGYVGLENSNDDAAASENGKKEEQQPEEVEAKVNGAMSLLETKTKPEQLTLVTDEAISAPEAEPSPRQESPPNEAYCTADELPNEDVLPDSPSNSPPTSPPDSPPASSKSEPIGNGIETQSAETAPVEEEPPAVCAIDGDVEQEEEAEEEGPDEEEDEEEGEGKPVIPVLSESSDEDCHHADFLPYEEPEFAWTEQELNEEQPFMDALGCRFVYANQTDSSHEDSNEYESSGGDEDFLFGAGDEEDSDSDEDDEDEETETRLEDEVIDLGTSRIIIRPVRRRLNHNSSRRRYNPGASRSRGGREIVVEEVEAGLVWPMVRRTMTRAVAVLRPYHPLVWPSLTFWEVGAVWVMCVWLFGNLSRRRVTRHVLR